MWLRLWIVAFCLNFIVVNLARADFTVAPFIGFDNSTSDSGTTKTTTSASGLALLAGYTFDFGLHLGAVFDSVASKIKTETGGTTTTTDYKFSAFGPGIGYRNSGFFITVHYLLEPNLESESGSTNTKYSGGTGSQFDIGYAFQLSSVFSLGLDYQTLVYNFDKRDTNGTTVDQELSYSDGTILVAMWFDF